MKVEVENTVNPGQGKGYGYPPRRKGGTNTCICPSCGMTISHARGIPCNNRTCPKCGSKMIGK